MTISLPHSVVLHRIHTTYQCILITEELISCDTNQILLSAVRIAVYYINMITPDLDPLLLGRIQDRDLDPKYWFSEKNQF